MRPLSLLMPATMVLALVAIVLELSLGPNIYTTILEVVGLSLVTPLLSEHFASKPKGLMVSSIAMAIVVVSTWLANKMHVEAYRLGLAASMWPLVYVLAWLVGSLAYIITRAEPGG